MVTARIFCNVFPSEDPEKVRDAILNIFPDAVLEKTDKGFKGEASMNKFCSQIRKQKILDSTRSVMFKGIRGNRIILDLNKQVAVVGKISFTEQRTILGTIQVIIECEDAESLIDTIAPRTVDGEEVRA